MKAMRKLIYAIFCGLIFILSSCSDFLDVVPDSVPRIENAFTLRVEAEKYLFTCYSYMPAHGSANGNPAFLGGDEVWITTKNRDRWALNAWRIATGAQNANAPYCDFWRGNNVSDLYQAINDCNIFLENVGKVPDLEVWERNRWIGEVTFLKAYYHYWLIRCYGPIVISDVSTSVTTPTEELYQYRQPLDSCFNYVLNSFDRVIENEDIPDRITAEADELGRVTKAITYAIKAEATLLAASPLYNGNTDYRSIKDNRGIAIFCDVIQPDGTFAEKTEAQKKARWQDAKSACKRAVDFAESLGYQLYEFNETGVLGLNDSVKVKLSIRNAVTLKWNVETIWGNPNSWVAGGLDLQSWPRGLDPAKQKNTTYAGNYGVPLKIAAQFYTKNGLPIDKDLTWDYNARFNLKKATSLDNLYVYEGRETVLFNLDREPRYYADLGFDGCIYYGFGNNYGVYGAMNGENPVTPLYVQGLAGQPAQSGMIETSYNPTGILHKKLVNYKSNIGAESGWTPEGYPWPVIRLANLYLMYAEALNEADDSQASRDEAISYIDKIRKRAGLMKIVNGRRTTELLGLKEAWATYTAEKNKPNSQIGLREIIRQERLIELAFEGQRFWDLRRWKLAANYLNAPITGWNIEGETAAEYYKEREVYQQTFQLRDYFWPIVKRELSANKNLVQNYGW